MVDGKYIVINDRRMQNTREFIFQVASYVFWYFYSSCFSSTFAELGYETDDAKGLRNPHIIGIPMKESHFAWSQRESKSKLDVLRYDGPISLWPSITELQSVCEESLKCFFSIGRHVTHKSKVDRKIFSNNIDGIYNNCYCYDHHATHKTDESGDMSTITLGSLRELREDDMIFVPTFAATVSPPYGCEFETVKQKHQHTTVSAEAPQTEAAHA